MFACSKSKSAGQGGSKKKDGVEKDGDGERKTTQEQDQAGPFFSKGIHQRSAPPGLPHH